MDGGGSVIFVPTSGLLGGNITEPCAGMTWWKGPQVGEKQPAKTLLQVLDRLIKPPSRLPHEPGSLTVPADHTAFVKLCIIPYVASCMFATVLLPVSAVYKIRGVGTVVTGR